MSQDFCSVPSGEYITSGSVLPPQDAAPKNHSVSAFLRVLFSIVFTAVMALALAGAVLISVIRYTVTPAFVYEYMNSLDLSALPITVSDEDGSLVSMSVEDAMILSADKLGLILTSEDVGYLLEGYAISPLVSACAQDIVSWFLFDGSYPLPDPDALAESLLTHTEDSFIALLYYFGDPPQLVSNMFRNLITQLQLETLLEDILTPIRPIFSSFAFVQCLVIAGFCFLMILLLNDGRCTKGLGYHGTSIILTAILTAAASVAITVFFMTSDNIYSSYVFRFLVPMRTLLLTIGVGCMLIGLLIIGIAFLCILCSRIHRKAKEEGPHLEQIDPE